MRFRGIIALALAAALLAGCAEKKEEPVRPQRKPPGAAGASDQPRYERYHTLWWISHTDLEDSVAAHRDKVMVNEKFKRTVASLRGMGRFLVDAGKDKLEVIAEEYERLRASENAAQAARRVVVGLNKLKNRVTNQFAPHNLDPKLKKKDE